METPYLPLAIFGDDYQNVYEPAEDTFLLLDALESDLGFMQDKAFVFLECGSGSGVVITALSKALGCNNSQARLMLATDINVEACRVTRKCASHHGQSSINVINTNLAESLVDRLENSVDVLIFNPPYVPTDSQETQLHESGNPIQLSWAGGHRGRKSIDQFIIDYVPRLLSKPQGRAYMVALDRNNVNDLTSALERRHDIRGSVILQRKAGIEMLFVIRYERIEHSQINLKTSTSSEEKKYPDEFLS